MVVDVGMRETLVNAGLVDPSGKFLSEPNFGGPSEGGVPVEPRPREEDGGDNGEPSEQPQEPKQPEQDPASQPQVVETPSAPSGRPEDLGQASPNRLGGADDPVRQSFDSTVAQLEQTAQIAFLQGRTAVNEQGERLYSDEELAQRIGYELQHYKQQAFLGAVMQKMQPVAKRAAAEQIAKEYGVGLEDIINEESPQAMSVRAKTIADLTRDGRFVARRESGADTAEGSRGYSNAIPEALENLSPQQKMYVGFARGDH